MTLFTIKPLVIERKRGRHLLIRESLNPAIFVAMMDDGVVAATLTSRRRIAQSTSKDGGYSVMDFFF